jgi:HEAT repeat protein
MRRLLASFAAFTLVAAAPGFASAAFAHGGQYKGPQGEVPPDSRAPSDPPPPPDGGGPSTPGGEPPGGPSTGGPDTGTPSTPGGGGSAGGGTAGGGNGGPTTGGSGGGGVSTGSGRAPGANKSVGSSWVLWWGYNKDAFLQIKSAAVRLRRPVASATASFGRTTDWKAVSDAEIREKIVPALRALLEDETQSFHVRSAAELALAKIGDASIVPTLERFATQDRKTLHREVVETAGLALGLLENDAPETRRFLIDVVADQNRGNSFVRPFSAISLGLMGRATDANHSAARALLDEAARKETGVDVKPSCFEALALLGDESAVPELLALVKNGKSAAPGAVALTDVDTAFAVAALGKIGAVGVDRPGEETCVLDEMLRLVDKEKSNVGGDVRRSAAIALGQLAPRCSGKPQRRALDAMKSLVEPAVDEQLRNFAVMSLGRFGAAKGVDAAARKEVVATLSKLMQQKGRGQTPAFAAMALGIVGRAICDEGGSAPEEEIRAPLRAKFKDGGDPHDRGAYALASGLVRDPLAVEEMRKTLEDRGADKRVRGWCALALGLCGDRGSIEAIRAAMNDDADRDLRVQAAMGAALVGDATVINDLITVVRDKESSNYELGSAAMGLGQIGDSHAVDALLELATDRANKWTDLTRALAVVALGQIGDRRDVPTLARLAADVNYRAHVPAIAELLSIL